MADPPSEPFFVALGVLRERLAQGLLAPGAHIIAGDLADELGLSTTPVREALSRLAGEDAIEDRRGQGYFVRRLVGADVADLYRLSLAHLLIVLEPRRPRRASLERGPTAPSWPMTGAQAVELVERLFAYWIASAGSPSMIRGFRRLQAQLGPLRRLEPALLPDLDGEARRLASLGETAPRAQRLAGLRQFHAVRIREANRFADLYQAAAESSVGALRAPQDGPKT